METIHIVLYRVIDEEPIDNYVLYIKDDLCYDCDLSKTTLKDMFLWLEGLIYPDFKSNYYPYMFKTFESSFNDSKCFGEKDANVYILELFDCSKPINIIRYPEYDGAGCWGESSGVRIEINYGENNHMKEPHVHVSNGDESNRINIINFEVMQDKHKRDKNLSTKNLKKALEIIKKYQFRFVEMWNYYSACDKIVDIEYLKEHKDLRLIEPDEVNDFYKKQQEMIQKHKWKLKDNQLKMV